MSTAKSTPWSQSGPPARAVIAAARDADGGEERVEGLGVDLEDDERHCQGHPEAEEHRLHTDIELSVRLPRADRRYA